jgi:hypothetical protein
MITENYQLKVLNVETTLLLLRKEYQEALKEDRCFHVLMEIRQEIKHLEKQLQEFMVEENQS